MEEQSSNLHDLVNKIPEPVFRARIMRERRADRDSSGTKREGASDTIQVSDVDVLLQQLLSILRRESEISPPPPKHLQVRVVVGYDQGYMESSLEIYEELNSVLHS